MYDYSCEESPFFKVDAQAYPSKAQQVGATHTPPAAALSPAF